MIRRRPAGFTLLELIVVMALMGIVFFFAVPRFEGSFFFDDAKQSTRWLIGKLQSLREEALRTRRQHILVFDLDAKRVWSANESMKVEDIELAMRRAQPIPGGARVIGVELPPEHRVVAGRAEIRFYGDGHSDMALIHLQRGEGYSSFLLEPFLTRVKTFDSLVGFKDLR